MTFYNARLTREHGSVACFHESLNRRTGEIVKYETPDSYYKMLGKGCLRWVKYLQSFQVTFNFHAKQSRCPLRVNIQGSIKYILHLAKNPREIGTTEEQEAAEEFFCDGLDDEGIDGIIYDASIRTAIDALNESVKSKDIPHLVIMGLTQLGKTMTMNCLGLIEPIYHELAGDQPFAGLTCAPNRRDIVTSHNIASNRFDAIHQKVVFYLKGKSGTLVAGDYMSRREKAKQQYVSNGDPVHANSPSSVDLFHAQINTLTKQGKIVVVYFDESHFGTEAAGVMNRNIQPFLDEMKNEHPNVRWRAISATPMEQIGLRNFIRIKHWIPEGYHGLRYFDGQEMPTIGDPDKITAPAIYDTIGYRGLNNQTDLDPHTYRSIKAFLKNVCNIRDRQEREDLQDDPHYLQLHKKYRKQYIKHLGGLVVECFDQKGKKGTIHEHMGHSRGIQLRPAKSNKDAREIAEGLRTYLKAHDMDDVVVIEYLSDNPNLKGTVKYTIAHHANSKKRYIIVFTGGARMSVSFPKHCGWFIDLTKEFGNDTSSGQGTWARATGVGKRSIVFLSPANYQGILYQYKHKGISLRRMRHARVARDNDSTTRGRKTVFNATLIKSVIKDSKDAAAKPIQRMFTKMEKVLNGSVKGVRHTSREDISKIVFAETGKAEDVRDHLFRQFVGIWDDCDLYDFMQNSGHLLRASHEEDSMGLMEANPVHPVPRIRSANQAARKKARKKAIAYARNGTTNPSKYATEGREDRQKRPANGYIDTQGFRYIPYQTSARSKTIRVTLGEQIDGDVKILNPQIIWAYSGKPGKKARIHVVAIIWPLRVAATKMPPDYGSTTAENGYTPPIPGPKSMMYKHDERYEDEEA